MNKTEINELVIKVQAGDNSAFEVLYNEFSDKVYYFSKRNVGNSDIAQDITSETFVTALEHISELRSGESFIGWLYAIAYSKCAKHLKESSHHQYYENDDDMEKAMNDATLNEPLMLPEDYAVNTETKEQLKRIIDELSPELKSAIIMYYYNDMSVSEVANSLGTNENNAKQKLHKARSVIRKKIEKLIGSGTLLAMVPLNSLLNNTIDAGYTQAVASGVAKASATGIMSKIAVGVAITATLGVSVALGNINGIIGDYRHEKDNNSDENIQIYNVLEFVFDEQSVVNTINGQKNLKASKNITFSVPEDISAIGEFEYNILPQNSFDDFEEDFFNMFETIFPDHTMSRDDKNYLYVDTTPEIEGSPVLSVEEYRDELTSGERNFLLLYYDEFAGNDFEYEDGQVMLQATTPMGCEIVRFNRGKIRKYLMDLTTDYAHDNKDATTPYSGVMEGFDITMMFSEIATHSPDSQESYKLIDKEVKICDAVKMYTEYVNSLPLERDEGIDYTVSEVEVYQLDDSTYCYRMISTLTYKGIPFNRGETGIFGDTYNQKGEIINTPYNVILSGIVAYSDEVDSIEGLPVSHTVSDYRNYEKLLSADSAVKTISSYMSEEIEFEVLSIELVYSGDFPKGNDFYDLCAVWKMVLRNYNDGKDYYCYIDAETGENFRYTAIPYKINY